jgi:heme/copper-type cytochrome/quinol oxidase subunit 2
VNGVILPASYGNKEKKPASMGIAWCFIWMNQQPERGSRMYANTFEILMMVALGALAGTGIGILIGFVAKTQKNEWSAMTRKEHTITIILVMVFCAICIAGLGYYYLNYSGF